MLWDFSPHFSPHWLLFTECFETFHHTFHHTGSLHWMLWDFSPHFSPHWLLFTECLETLPARVWLSVITATLLLASFMPWPMRISQGRWADVLGCGTACRPDVEKQDQVFATCCQVCIVELSRFLCGQYVWTLIYLRRCQRVASCWQAGLSNSSQIQGAYPPDECAWFTSIYLIFNLSPVAVVVLSPSIMHPASSGKHASPHR